MIEALVVKAIGVAIISVGMVVEFVQNRRSSEFQMNASFWFKMLGLSALLGGLIAETIIATRAV